MARYKQATKSYEYWKQLEIQNEEEMMQNGIERFKKHLADPSENGIACNVLYNELYEIIYDLLKSKKHTRITTAINYRDFASSIAMFIAYNTISNTVGNALTNTTSIITNAYADVSSNNNEGIMEICGFNTNNEYVSPRIKNAHYFEDHDEYMNGDETTKTRLHQKVLNDETLKLQSICAKYVHKVLSYASTLLSKFEIENKSNFTNIEQPHGVDDYTIGYLVQGLTTLKHKYKEQLSNKQLITLCDLINTIESFNQVLKYECFPKLAEPTNTTINLDGDWGTLNNLINRDTTYNTAKNVLINNNVLYVYFLEYVNRILATCISKSKLIEEVEDTSHQKILKLTAEGLNRFDVERASTMFARPMYYAMCVKPIDWKLIPLDEVRKSRYSNLPDVTHRLNAGGYLKAKRKLIPRLRKDYQPPEQEYLNGNNKAQSTAFNINIRVYNAMMEMGYEYKPDAFCDIYKTKENKPRDWSNERWLRYKASIESKNAQANQIMFYATKYKEWDNVYFPVYDDNRGRSYYVPNYLSPQSTDQGKALLVFAEPSRPLTKRDLDKYKILISGLYGVDKSSISKRKKWFESNEEVITRLGSDVRDIETMKFFCNSDNPWQTLAACYDYVEFMHNIKETGEHWSFIYAGKDGKCNGLQHWSAILRDVDGAAKVGIIKLTEEQDPDDVYNEVGKNLLYLINNDINEGANDAEIERQMDASLIRVYKDKDVNKILATNWHKFITKTKNRKSVVDRSFVKRPTMTSTYSAGQKAFKNFVKLFMIDNGIETVLSKHGKGCKFKNDEQLKTAHITYISKYLQYAVDMTIKLRKGMQYVQECVKHSQDTKSPIHWKTKLGFHVYLDDLCTYRTTSRVKIKEGNYSKQITVLHQIKDCFDYRKFATAIAPDFIHGNDSTHMFMTVTQAKSIKNWALVHDDYATSLCDWEVLDVVIRDQFVELYINPKQLLLDFQRDVCGTTDKVKLPDIDHSNALDINTVKDSLYFFI